MRQQSNAFDRSEKVAAVLRLVSKSFLTFSGAFCKASVLKILYKIRMAVYLVLCSFQGIR